MRRNDIAIAACLGLSSLALAVALVAVVATSAPPSPSPDATDIEALRARLGGIEDGLVQREALSDSRAATIQSLGERIAALEDRLERRGGAGGETPGGGPATRGDDAAWREDLEGWADEVEDHLEELAGRVEAVERGGGAGGAGLLPGTPRISPEERQREMREARGVAVDRSRPVTERLRALRALRAIDGRDRRTTQAMIELFRDPSLDARIRADIIRQLDEVTFPELVPPLLEVLSTAESPEIRSEAVETLQPFYDRPQVRSTVDRLAQEDPSPEVREEARRRLAQWDPERAPSGRRDGDAASGQESGD